MKGSANSTKSFSKNSTKSSGLKKIQILIAKSDQLDINFFLSEQPLFLFGVENILKIYFSVWHFILHRRIFVWFKLTLANMWKKSHVSYKPVSIPIFTYIYKLLNVCPVFFFWANTAFSVVRKNWEKIGLRLSSIKSFYQQNLGSTENKKHKTC